MKKIFITIGFIFIISSITGLPFVDGIPVYVQDLPTSFKDHCTTCHIASSGKGGLNNFGSDYEHYGYSMERIAKLDSDNDGFTNSQEFENGTFPGDSDSYPNSHSTNVSIELILFVIMLLIAGIILIWLLKFRR